MKIIKWLFVLLLVAAAVAGVVMHEEKTGAKRVETETRNAADAVKDAATDAVSVSTKAMTEAATNAAAKAKAVTTNVVGEVKQKLDQVSH